MCVRAAALLPSQSVWIQLFSKVLTRWGGCSVSCDPLGDLCNRWEAYLSVTGLLQPHFTLNTDIFFLCWWERDTWLSCIFATHPITLIPFPASHPVFLGQECDFIVLTVRWLLMADSLLVAPRLSIVVRCRSSASQYRIAYSEVRPLLMDKCIVTEKHRSVA